MNQVSESTDHPEPVIEPSNGGAATVELATRALHLRIRHQEILAELGVQALQGKPFFDLLDQTARLTAEGMEAECCEVLEYARGKLISGPRRCGPAGRPRGCLV